MYDPKLMPGTNHCKCAVCGEYFTTPDNFDLHRIWAEKVGENARTRVCRHPSTIVRGKGKSKGKARLHLNSKGLWAETGGVYIPPDEVS